MWIDAGVVIADFSDYVDKYQRDAKRCPDDFLHEVLSRIQLLLAFCSL